MGIVGAIRQLTDSPLGHRPATPVGPNGVRPWGEAPSRPYHLTPSARRGDAARRPDLEKGYAHGQQGRAPLAPTVVLAAIPRLRDRQMAA